VNKKRNGIIAGGNFIRDYTRIIDEYPSEETLANILGIDSNNGGAAYNVLKNLAIAGAKFPLAGIGMIGNDETGKEILRDCKNHHIDISRVSISEKAGTSFTDVMVVKSTGKRTFFHYRGANALLGPEHFNFDQVSSRIFHFGYPLLLDKLDTFDDKGKTLASHVLQAAAESGLIVTMDLVSVNNNRFREIVMPGLPFTDYLFLNEIEAEKLSGISLIADGSVSIPLARSSAEKILGLGVKDSVIIHFPAGCILHSRKQFITQGSILIPPGNIAGATGAGDAFASGFLYGLYENFSPDECLHAAVCMAASCLLHESCSAGILPFDQCLALGKQNGFRTIT
jgi:sugar/nucleoside kinase (ribokinase family)